MRLRARGLIVSGMIGLSAAGCGPRTLAYAPRDVTPLPQLTQLSPMAVYLFADKRGLEDRRIGTSVFEARLWTSADPIYASEPVALAVTRAFIDGLRARGFRVIDMTKTPFAPGQPGRDARLAVSGEVARFWEESVLRSATYGPSTWRAECVVVLRTYEPASGRPLWEKTYRQADETASRVLARTVEAALKDPELIQQLSRIPE